MIEFEVIVIVLLVVSAMSTLVAAGHRRDGNTAGRLSRETLRRDHPRRRSGEVRRGRELEVSTITARTAPTAVMDPASITPITWVAPTLEMLGVTRRHFLNRSIIVLVGFGTVVFASASFTAFLWPTASGGFGSKLAIGKINDILAGIDKADGFLYLPEGQMWVTRYPADSLPKAQLVYKGEPILDGMAAGIVALYQKCPHLGCRVPSCLTSQWFECPCHGSQYSRVGEKHGGPAPRGMDRFAVEVDGADITVDTSNIVTGPPIGTDTTGQEPQGPHCVTGGGG